jgi:sugar O-acyltransferase (sialic acid O-acetyltransferase NeuD family)
MQNIVIFGASGHGSVVLDCIEKEGKYKIVGFIDSFKKKGSKQNGYEILGSEYDLPYLVDKHNLFGGVVAIGDNWIRQVVVKKITRILPQFTFISTIHPSAILGMDVRIGSGVVILPGVIINSNSKVSDHCILNTYASLDHDGVMQEFSSLAPRVCTGGNLNLGKFSSVCLGTQVIENISIGQHSVIGAGSLVLRNVESFTLSYGTPSQFIRKRSVGDPYLTTLRFVNSTLINTNANNF